MMVAQIIAILIFSFLFGFFYRSLLKQFSSPKMQKRANININKNGRILRGALGIGLLALGIYTKSQITIFAAGFCFFEAIFSWCGFNALIGRNSCDL